MEPLSQAKKHFGGTISVRKSKYYNDIIEWTLTNMLNIGHFINVIGPRTYVKKHNLELLTEALGILQDSRATTETGFNQVLDLMSQFRNKKARKWNPDKIREAVKAGAMFYAAPMEYPQKMLMKEGEHG